MTRKFKSYLLNIIFIVTTFLLLLWLINSKTINQYYSRIIMKACIAVIMAVSLNLTTGFLGELALGHAGFMAIGAFTSAIITKNMQASTYLSFPIALIAGGLLAAVFGLLIGIPALRLKGDYLAIITLGFGEIVRVILNNMKLTGGAQGLYGIKRLTDFSTVFVIMVLIIVCLFTLGRSRHGRAILSIRESPVAAESTGIPTTYYKIFAFTLAAFFAGIAGGLYAHLERAFAPKDFSFTTSIDYLVMVVFGGMGSITGSIISATVLTFLTELLRSFSEYRMLVYSLLLILMMLFRPKGLMGTAEFSLIYVWETCSAFLSKLFSRFKRKREKAVIMPAVPMYDCGDESMPVLETRNLGIRFGGLQAAENVDIKLFDNEIVGLIGPNGAGKTTVFNMLTGVYKPTDGEIILLGKPIGGKPTHVITANGIARTFQNIRLFKSMTVLENIKVAFHTRMHYTVVQGMLRMPQYAREERGIDVRAMELLRVFNMESVAQTRADGLSYGQQRKLEICRALASNPKVLLLDEPAAGMNPIETEELMSAIKIIRERFNVAVLLIEHDMKLVMGICERIYVLNYGRLIAQGTPEEIARNSDVIAAYLGNPAQEQEAATC